MKLYFGKIEPSSVGASGSDQFFPVENVRNTAIDAPYMYSATPRMQGGNFVNANPSIGILLPKIEAIAGVFFYDINFESPYCVAYDQANAMASVAFDVCKNAYLRGRGICKINTYANYIVAVLSGVATGNPQDGGLTYSVTAAGPVADRYVYRKISALSHTVDLQDALVYEVSVDPLSPVSAQNEGIGGLDVDVVESPYLGRSLPLLDTIGRGGNLEPIGARNGFVTRVIPLAPLAGKTISGVTLANDSNVIGKYMATFRNIRIDRGGDVYRRIYVGGVPDSDVEVYSDGYYDSKLSWRGGPANGEKSWRCGAVYVFAKSVSATSPEISFSVETDHAEARQDFDNKDFISTRAGTRRDKISGKFMIEKDALGSAGVDELLRALREEVAVIDMEDADNPHWIWPVKASRPTDVRTKTFPRVIEVEFDLTEVC